MKSIKIRWPRRVLSLIILGICVMGAATTRASQSPITVERWDLLELTFQGPANGNPFTEVELSAQFTRKDRTVRVAGFYDGQGVYKIRFMPDALGEWRYQTLSNRPELNLKSGFFLVTAPSPKNHGPVRVQHTFHFAYADGTPYFQLGTTAYSW